MNFIALKKSQSMDSPPDQFDPIDRRFGSISWQIEEARHLKNSARMPDCESFGFRSTRSMLRLQRRGLSYREKKRHVMYLQGPQTDLVLPRYTSTPWSAHAAFQRGYWSCPIQTYLSGRDTGHDPQGTCNVMASRSLERTPSETEAGFSTVSSLDPPQAGPPIPAPSQYKPHRLQSLLSAAGAGGVSTSRGGPISPQLWAPEAGASVREAGPSLLRRARSR